jgi:hypothetical protein
MKRRPLATVKLRHADLPRQVRRRHHEKHEPHENSEKAFSVRPPTTGSSSASAFDLLFLRERLLFVWFVCFVVGQPSIVAAAKTIRTWLSFHADPCPFAVES